MNLADVTGISIPEGEVVKIESIGAVIWEQVEEAAYKNWVPFSINADGSIYNGGLGYKDGYRLSSGGSESVSSNATTTGFIPANPGDVVRIAGYKWLDTSSAINYLNAYNSKNGFGKVYAGNARNTYDSAEFIESMEYANGVSTVKLKNGVNSYDYIRISLANASGGNLIVTINEEIVT